MTTCTCDDMRSIAKYNIHVYYNAVWMYGLQILWYCSEMTPNDILFIDNDVISEQPLHLSLQTTSLSSNSPSIYMIYLTLSTYLFIYYLEISRGQASSCCPVYNQFWSQVCTDRQTAQCMQWIFSTVLFVHCLSVCLGFFEVYDGAWVSRMKGMSDKFSMVILDTVLFTFRHQLLMLSSCLEYWHLKFQVLQC